jgi:Flagellar hook-length control protein FliK
MSGAPVAVAPANEGPSLSSAPPKGATADAQSAESGSGPSFTEVLSQEQRGGPRGREKSDGNPDHPPAGQSREHSSHVRKDEPAGAPDAASPSVDLPVDEPPPVGVAPAPGSATLAVGESTGRNDTSPDGLPSPRVEGGPAESPDVVAPPTASNTDPPDADHDAAVVAGADPGHLPTAMPTPTAPAVIGDSAASQPATVAGTSSLPPALPAVHQLRAQEGGNPSMTSADRSETPSPAHVGPTTGTPNPPVHAAPPAADRPMAPLVGSHFFNEGAHGTGAMGAVARAGDPAAFFSLEESPAALDVDGLSSSISRPLSDGNGTYTVAVAMHPSDLGHLHAVMSLEGNDLQVQITPQTRTGHEALTNAAEALKNQLASAGLNVNVTLRDPGSSSGGDDRFEAQTSGASADVENAAPLHSPMPVLVSGQIHLVL